MLGFRLPERVQAGARPLGVAPQLDNLDVTLTVEQNLLVFTHLYRIERTERRAAIERALRMANLVDRRDTRVDKLSGGMRRRLLIARALVHRPRLVLLDEPTVGLDPQVRQELWALIDALRAEGTTILMSTHYIEEAAAPRRHRPDHVPRQRRRRRAAVAARRRARGPRGDRGLRAARRSWPRSRRRPARRACARGARARASPCSASRAPTGARRRASAARPTSRTSSCC